MTRRSHLLLQLRVWIALEAFRLSLMLHADVLDDRKTAHRPKRGTVRTVVREVVQMAHDVVPHHRRVRSAVRVAYVADNGPRCASSASGTSRRRASIVIRRCRRLGDSLLRHWRRFCFRLFLLLLGHVFIPVVVFAVVTLLAVQVLKIQIVAVVRDFSWAGRIFRLCAGFRYGCRRCDIDRCARLFSRSRSRLGDRALGRGGGGYGGRAI